MNWNLNEFTKNAFAKLVKEFEENTDDVVKITKAFSTAADLHSGQSRDGSKEPYINHPLKVALILSDELKIRDVDLICAHFFMTFCKRVTILIRISLIKLRKILGRTCTDIVQTLTEHPSTNDNRQQSLESYFQSISKSPKTLRVVELADRLDNVRFFKNAVKKDKAIRYKEETQKYVVPIAEQTDETLAFKLSVALYEIK